MTQQELDLIVDKYVKAWLTPMFVTTADPGDFIASHGVRFGLPGEARAGMHVVTGGTHIIFLNKRMSPESLLQTFFHEYGHAIYERDRTTPHDIVASEVAAITHSLEALDRENLQSLASREAQAVLDMSVDEPYRSAVQRLANNPLWLRYSRQP